MKKAACVLLIRSSDGKLLAASRRDEHDNIGLPGGKIDKGECPKTAATREFYEETGIHVTPNDLTKVYIRPCVGETDYETTTFLCFTETSSIDYEINTEPYECEKGIWIRWVAWDELLAPKNAFAKYNAGLYEHVRPMLQQ